jgi:hypothetical protein
VFCGGAAFAANAGRPQAAFRKSFRVTSEV